MKVYNILHYCFCVVLLLLYLERARIEVVPLEVHILALLV